MLNSDHHDFSRLEFSMRLIDVGAIWAAGELVSLVRFNAPLIETAPIHSVLLYFCCALAFFLFPQIGLYNSWRGRAMISMLLMLTTSWSLTMLVGIIFSFLIHQINNLSRLWIFYWYVIGFLLLTMSRMTLYSLLKYLRKSGLNSKRVVIVGYGQIGREMHRRATENESYGYAIKAIYPCSDCIDDLQNSQTTYLSKIENISTYVMENSIHEIWITLPISATKELKELQFFLRNALVDIRWVPDTLSMNMLSNRVIDFLGLPAVDLNHPVAQGMGGIFKDLFDKAFSLIALIFLMPVFVAIAIGIKMSSPGPIFFKQPRLGLNGKKFNVYKFRTMQLHQEKNIITQATKNDPRITKIGNFLRRTSLDELPQFFNVLLGDMSVVGPRPHALQHNEMYKDILEMYMQRHRVKPGITGWAQIHGYRGETDTIEKMAKRVQFDLHYIQNWSLGMDIRIVIWTAFKGWTGKNAY